jgi:hypothetical protein
MTEEELAERLNKIVGKIVREINRAREKHGPFHSTHEAYAVILEELEEWWESVKADEPDDDELISVAAMSMLAVAELGGQNINDEYVFGSPGEDDGAGYSPEA